MYRWIYPLIIGLASLGPAAYAHHSIPGLYDRTREATVEGVVTEFRFINPHPFLILSANAGTAAPQSWHILMDNHFELGRAGITADTFKPGDLVVVTGDPGRTQAWSLYLRRLDRPADGFRYEQVDGNPTISIQPEAAAR